MKLGKITKDALEYPFLDMRKILVLGFLIVLTDLPGYGRGFGVENQFLIFLSGILGALIGIYVLGYLYKVVVTSNTRSPPRFSGYTNIFKDGLKIFTTVFVYMVPALAVLAAVTIQHYVKLYGMTYGVISTEPLTLIGILLGTLVWPGIFNIIGLLYNASIVSGVYIQLAIIYILLIIPIIFKAVRNMACEGEFVSAFKIGIILKSIWEIGILKIILWYITTGLLFLIILLIGVMVTNIFSYLIYPEIGVIILSFTVLPYLYIFLARSVSLAFQEDIKRPYGAYIF